jgi:hypothetical protein
MRRIPYFAGMTDAQLRQQRLPPGMKAWGEVAGVTQQLDGLNWMMLPPETGPQGAPAPDGAATDSLILRWLTASEALPVPSPTVEAGPDGQESTTWRGEAAWIQVERRSGDERAIVRISPDPLGGEAPVRQLEVVWDPDPLTFRTRVVDALRALASPSPTP